MESYDTHYYVRLVRADKQADEIYHYWRRKEAEYHFNLFKDDDSGLYSHVDLLLVDKDRSMILEQISFDERKQFLSFSR